jgi:hypothetical protein
MAVSIVSALFLHLYTHLRIHKVVKDYLTQKVESLAYSISEDAAEAELARDARTLDVDYIFTAKLTPQDEYVIVKISSGKSAASLMESLANRLKSDIIDDIAENTFLLKSSEGDFYTAYRQIWKATDVYIGVILDRSKTERLITKSYLPLFALFALFPPIMAVLGFFIGRMLEKPLNLLSEQLNDLADERQASPEDKKLPPFVMRELLLIREKVLKAHHEYNLAKQSYEEKLESIEKIKRELEQNTNSRAALLESDLENLKIDRQQAASDLELLERNFLYQTGYTMSGNLIQDILSGLQLHFNQMLESLKAESASAPFNINEVIQRLEKMQTFFEPFFAVEFIRLEEAAKLTCALSKVLLLHRVKLNCHIAENVKGFLVPQESVRVCAAASSLLISMSTSGREINIDVSRLNLSENQLGALIAIKVLESGTAAVEIDRGRTEQLSNLADTLPYIVKFLLNGRFRLSRNPLSAEIHLALVQDSSF